MSCTATSLPATTTTITGEVTSVSGGHKAGKETQMTIDDTQWWPIPATAMVGRAGVGMQNEETVASKKFRVNFDNTAPFVGTIVYAYGERFYQIDESVIIYAKAFPGETILLNVEELANI